MTLLTEIPPVIEVTEWFVVFSHHSATRWLAAITPGRRKHVAAFGYLPGVARWLCYDVAWSGTRIMLLDKAAVMAWTAGCDVVKAPPIRRHPSFSSRLGLYCVPAVKQLIGCLCVAATPDQLYRHILRNGGILISEQRPPGPSPAAGRSDAGDRAAAGAK